MVGDAAFFVPLQEPVFGGALALVDVHEFLNRHAVVGAHERQHVLDVVLAVALEFVGLLGAPKGHDGVFLALVLVPSVFHYISELDYGNSV